MLRLTLSFFLIFAAQVWAQEDDHTISVTGVGSVQTVPDIAHVSVGMSSDARTAREAMERNGRVMSQVLSTLAERGVENKDVQTTELSLFPSYENRTTGKPPAVVGYRAQNVVSVTVREIEILGGILDAVTVAGGNTIHSIRFDVEDTVALMDEARKAAVLDARKKAEIYATAGGVSLGKVISINEMGGARPMPRTMARMEAMTADVPVAEGSVSLSVSVGVVFLIE